MTTERTSNDYLIWWTTSVDVAAIKTVDPNSIRLRLPDYIRTELAGRCGRNGRGRLWVHPEIQAEFGGPFSPLPHDLAWESRLGMLIAEFSAGIVIRKQDLVSVVMFPGILTDHRLNEVGIYQFSPTALAADFGSFVPKSE